MRTILVVRQLLRDLHQIVEEIRKGGEVELVFLQDGTVFAAGLATDPERLEDLAAMGVTLYVLKGDADRRGVTDRMPTIVQLIDYDRLIDVLFQDGRKVINL